MAQSPDREELSSLKDRLLEGIDGGKDGKRRCKIKRLLAEFGYTASQRLRQSSLAVVLQTLTEWGIDYRLPPEGVTSDAYVTLSRRPLTVISSQQLPEPVAVPVTPTPLNLRILRTKVSPFSFAFRIGENLENGRTKAAALDIQNAIWSFRPVFLLLETEDEFFAFACGFLSAIMRRRSLMMRHGVLVEAIPTSPEIVTTEYLKQQLGMSLGPDNRANFPASGAVYVMRVQSQDLEDDDIAAFIRECFVPHTYRVKAKYATTSRKIGSGPRAEDSSDFPSLLEWLRAFSGTMTAEMPSTDQLLDLASLMTEASQVREALLDRKALATADASFKAGFESTEHMVLKSSLLNGLRRLYPGEEIAVEELLPPNNDDEIVDVDSVDRQRRDKPDLRIGEKLWIEVETLRALSLRGSNPFFELESKLRRKVKGMQTVKEVWLIFPSDVAMLATAQIAALTRNLNAVIGGDRIRMGFVDLFTDEPVFLADTPPTFPEVQMMGASWRIGPPPPSKPLTWQDIAGYDDLKKRLRADLLDPLLNPEQYSKHGIEAANGLLLYGLPGCGKSLIGKVMAGETDLVCRFVFPSDLTSMWLGEGVRKIRDLFDWALKHAPCLLVLDELDAVASQRKELNMHADEKRQVNELLVQLDRISEKGVVVVATSNYVMGIDSAIRRSGRFDIKLPVLPPTAQDRQEIFRYYLSPPQLLQFAGIASIDLSLLASESILFTPSDIKAVVQTAARRAIFSTSAGRTPSLSTDILAKAINEFPRSVSPDMAEDWLKEAQKTHGPDDPGIAWLKTEIELAESVSSHE